MIEQESELFILGATGFVGKEVVREAVRRGLRVKALVRDREKAAELANIGALLVQGDAASPNSWIGETAGSKILIDLVQPALPKRIGLKAIKKAAESRIAITQRLLDQLKTIPSNERPLLMSISGLDDLAPDELGNVHDDSPLRDQPVGFGHIGIPVRRLIEGSDTSHAFAYLGTVYGPGKTFATTIFPQLAEGRFRIIGNGRNRMPIVHVEDAARALVHLATLTPDRLSGRSFVITDGANASMNDFLGHAAELLGAATPRKVPVWLAKIFAGSILSETLTRDLNVIPSGLLSSGFTFKYPSYVEGLPPTLKALGYPSPTETREATTVKAGRNLRFWVLFVAAVGSILALNLFDFPLSVLRMREMAGGLSILDLRPWYSGEDVYRLFDALGEVGRSAYLRQLWIFDLFLPSLFALFLSAAIKRGELSRLRWVPFLAAASDYAENVAITSLLLSYPTRHPALVTLSATFTLLKHGWYLTSIVVAIASNFVRYRKRSNAGNKMAPA